jgi:hypothetical protein
MPIFYLGVMDYLCSLGLILMGIAGPICLFCTVQEFQNNELILTFSITCKTIILHPNFVFFSQPSAAMLLQKAFIRAQKHNFSVENKKSR